jgi:hypothetical protein
MKCNHAAIATLTAVVQFLVLSHTKVAHAITGDDIDGSNSDALFKYDFVDLPTHFATRSLEENYMCSDACKEGNVSSLATALQSDTQKQVGDGSGSLAGLFGQIVGFFTNTKSISKRGDEKQYMIPTGKILPLLSNYRSKFISLAKMLREESMNVATVSNPPDLVQLMYNISADNMESIATILDPIMNEMRQQDSMHVRDVSCRMIHILSLVRDETLPNIERVAQVLYTKSNNATMKDAFDKYNGTKSSTKLNDADVALNMEDNTCMYKSSEAKMLICTEDCSVIASIITIITSLVLIPTSLVAGFAYSIYFFILGVLFILVSPGQGVTFFGKSVQCFLLGFVGVFFLTFFIINSIKQIFKRLLSPLLPVPVQVPSPTPFSIPRIRDNELHQTNDIMHRLSDVLGTPLDTISDLLQDNNFSKLTQDKKDAIDCEVSVLTCKNHALVEALPF